MKANIDSKGYIVITAQSPIEAFALNHIAPDSNICPECKQVKIPFLIDCSILNQDNGDANESRS